MGSSHSPFKSTRARAGSPGHFLNAWSLLAIFLIIPTQTGEWMFRLKDAHVQMRQALFDKNAAAAWEHLDRETRQDAGILAWRIREQFAGLPPGKQAALRARLGQANVASLRGADLLVAPFFLEAHAYMLVGDRDDTKLKGVGTRMAGPPTRRAAFQLGLPSLWRG